METMDYSKNILMKGLVFFAAINGCSFEFTDP